jgi:hypothetical protein
MFKINNVGTLNVYDVISMYAVTRVYSVPWSGDWPLLVSLFIERGQTFHSPQHFNILY